MSFLPCITGCTHGWCLSRTKECFLLLVRVVKQVYVDPYEAFLIYKYSFVAGKTRSLNHIDTDLLYSKVSALRWLVVDEVSMIPTELVDEFLRNLTEAATDTYFKRDDDKAVRVAGGYNLLMFGDLFQLPPIPLTSTIIIPPFMSSFRNAISGSCLNLFWGTDSNSLTYFRELTVQMRVKDAWYTSVLMQCRYGMLSCENYNFLMGLPTAHPGSWVSTLANVPPRSVSSGSASGDSLHIADEGVLTCAHENCQNLGRRWREMALQGKTWSEMRALECTYCQKERIRMNRLLSLKDERVKRDPFLRAPYVHKNKRSVQCINSVSRMVAT